MDDIDRSKIKVFLGDELNTLYSAKEYLIDVHNGAFNNICYEAIKKHWVVKADGVTTDGIFRRCMAKAYMLAWELLVDEIYNQDWGWKGTNTMGFFASPSCDSEVLDDSPLHKSKYLRMLFPILWHLLQRIDIDKAYGDSAVCIRDAVCYQIKKQFVDTGADSTFFKELNKAFGVCGNELLIRPGEKHYGERAISASVFKKETKDLVLHIRSRRDMFHPTRPPRINLHDKRQPTEATNDEVNEAILKMKPSIKAKFHWSGVIAVLETITAFRVRIDDKYSHRRGQHENQVKKYIVKEIAELIEEDADKLYNSVKHTTHSYVDVSARFEAILKNILTN